jgi:hypothetical protein
MEAIGLFKNAGKFGITFQKTVFDSRCGPWNTSLTSSFRLHYGPGVDSACNRNEYQGYIQGVKAAGAWGLQSCHPCVPIV